MPTLSKAFGLAGPCKQSGKLTTPLLVLLAIFLFGRPAEAQYGGGTGEPNDPYLIYTAEQMNAIGADANDWNNHFILMADIDLSAYTGTDFNIIGYWRGYSDNRPFTGVFDGNGKKISNFNCTRALFGYVNDPNTVIRDLGLIDPNVDAGTGNWLGSLVDELRDGTISGCYVEGGSVTGKSYVGGLVGENGGTITNCYSTGSVSGNDHVGGLVGRNGWWRFDEGSSRGTIFNCYSTASVSGTTAIGGLAGSNGGCHGYSIIAGTISNCYSAGRVTGHTDVGSLVGWNRDTITNCYSSGAVMGTKHVGGLVGTNRGDWYFSIITNCYSVGSVSGTTDVGGLVGLNDGGEVYNSFWDIETSGQASSDGGTGLTTGAMQMGSTFIGWGCESVWTVNEGVDYPRLWWENKPGEALYIQQLSDFLIGSGTEGDPYLIYTAEELNIMSLFWCEWDKHFKLLGDIDLFGFTDTDFNIIGNRVFPFTGVFDGNAHTISNFSYTSTDRNYYIGLFGYVYGENAQIKDLGLIDPNIDAVTGHFVGSLVGRLSNGTITNCYAEGGSVSGGYRVGGLVGDNDGTITDCYSITSVSGDSLVGSIVGDNGGRITNCYSTGSVSGNERVGGLVGENDGTISNCYATGGVSGGYHVGGLVGLNWDTITNCYATGSVSGNEDVGGLVGLNNYGTITNCYSEGSGTGTTDVGGLVGENRGTITNCYSVGSVTGTTDVGGLIGSKSEYGTLTVTDSVWDIETSGQTTSNGGTGKTTAEMQMESTFTDAGWDFLAETVNGTEDIWWILEGQDYPRLWWELVGN